METGPPFSSVMPNGNVSLFQTTTSNHPTTASVTFGVPTLASMTQKDSTGLKPAMATSRSAGLTAAYVRSTQTKLEEADSESSMPCSLPDDIANRYARYVDNCQVYYAIHLYSTVLMQWGLFQVQLQLPPLLLLLLLCMSYSM